MINKFLIRVFKTCMNERFRLETYKLFLLEIVVACYAGWLPWVDNLDYTIWWPYDKWFNMCFWQLIEEILIVLITAVTETLSSNVKDILHCLLYYQYKYISLNVWKCKQYPNTKQCTIWNSYSFWSSFDLQIKNVSFIVNRESFIISRYWYIYIDLNIFIVD